MKLFLRQTGLLFRKDLRTEFRELHHLISIVLFGIILLLLFSFALSAEPDLMRRMAPGLFWLTILFSSILSLDYSLRREREGGQWEGLLMLGVDPRALYLGKLLANLAVVLILQVVLLPVMAVLYDLPISPALLTVVILGSLGITALGTFYAGLTASLQEGQLLLPLLLFPMLVPLILAAVKVTDLALAHDLFGQQVAWLKLLVVFDLVFLVGSLLSSEAMFDEGG